MGEKRMAGPAKDETGTTLRHLSPSIHEHFQDRRDHAPNLRPTFQEPSKPTAPSGQPLLGREQANRSRAQTVEATAARPGAAKKPPPPFLSGGGVSANQGAPGPFLDRLLVLGEQPH